MIQSKLLSINWRDALKSVLYSAVSAVILTAYTEFEAGEVPDLHSLITSAGSGVCGYLMVKFFLTNSEGKVLVKEPDKKVR